MADRESALERRLESLTHDPIRTSLRASIRERGTAFKVPLDEDGDFLSHATTLDVWEGAGGIEVVQEEHPLSPHLPKDLFKKRRDKGYKLKLRFLVTCPTFVIYESKTLDDDGSKQTHYLPFMPDDMYDLITGYNLPYQWMKLRYLSPEVGSFFRKTGWDRSSRPHNMARRYDFLDDLKEGPQDHAERPAYHPFRDDLFLWSLALCYTFETGQTRGLIDGVTSRGLQDIRDRIKPGEMPWVEHPLHFPMIFLNIHVDHVACEVYRLTRVVGDFEDFSKNAKYKTLEDGDSITTQLAYIKRSLGYQQNLVKFLQDTLDFLDQNLLERNEWEHSVLLHNACPQIKEDLANTSWLIQNNLDTCDYLQTRAKDALDYVTALYADDNSKISARDARSTYAMSILQMVFLPATAVAAICSMNTFNWNTPSPPNGVGVSPYIWIYWVISLIATITVLVVWSLTAWIKGQSEKPKAIEQKENQEDAIYRDRLRRERDWVGGRGRTGKELREVFKDAGDDERHGLRARKRESSKSGYGTGDIEMARS